MRAEVDPSLLLAHMQEWARPRGRVADIAVLTPLLELRSSYDDPDPTHWPPGSVSDLLLRLWPAKGDGDAPEPGAAAMSIDTFMRFLRNTGRMASGSGEPKELAREARRAAPKMGELASDRSAWSPGKVLADYGETIGLSLDGAGSVEDLKARLELVNASWNSLPIHERRRLMPSPGDEHVSGCERAMQAYGIDDPPVALLLGMRHELPTGRLATPEVTAPYARESGLLRDVRRLLAALGEKVTVTTTGVVRPAEARELHATLGLEAWDRDATAFSGWQQDPQWRSARDLGSLQRLWSAAAAVGWIDVRATTAYVRPPGDLDDEALVDFGVTAALGITREVMSGWGEGCGLLYALVRSYVLHCDRVSWDECAAFLASWEHSEEQLARLRSYAFDVVDMMRERVRQEAFWLADSGVADLDEAGLALTPLGDIFVAALLKYLER